MNITLNDLLFSLSRALDFVEQELLGITTNHGKRTAYLSMRLSRAMGCSEQEMFDMASCAVLHDNALTTYMLENRGADIAHLENLDIHCELGEKNAANFPFLLDASGIILYHHENWNGRGVHKLGGDDIPLRSAILRLTDNADLRLHMGDKRPELEKELREHALQHKGTLYSPRVVEALLDILDQEFVSHLHNSVIDNALNQAMPPVGRELSTKELLQVCRIFASIIDAKSPFTQSHSQGIADKASFMGKIYGFDEEHCDKLSIAAFLHDVGKLSTPLSILEKPGPLTSEEFGVMKKHVEMSWEILRAIHGLEEITAWGASHHEKLDHSGYPYGWGEEQLPFEARLMTCCDIYQALTEDRPYRQGMEHKAAIAIMRDMVDKKQVEADIVNSMDRELERRQTASA